MTTEIRQAQAQAVSSFPDSRPHFFFLSVNVVGRRDGRFGRTGVGQSRWESCAAAGNFLRRQREQSLHFFPSSIPFSFTITITTSQRQTCKEICKAGPSISTDGIFSGGPVLIFAQLITNHDTMRPVGLGVSNIQRPRYSLINGPAILSVS